MDLDRRGEERQAEWEGGGKGRAGSTGEERRIEGKKRRDESKRDETTKDETVREQRRHLLKLKAVADACAAECIGADKRQRIS